MTTAERTRLPVRKSGPAGLLGLFALVGRGVRSALHSVPLFRGRKRRPGFGRAQPLQRFGNRREADVLARLERMTSQGRTLIYLVQSCLLMTEPLVFPRRARPPMRPRTPPLGGRELHHRRHPTGPVTSSKAMPGLIGVTLVMPALILVAAIAGLTIYDSYREDLKPPQELTINQPLIGAKVYDRNGELLYEFLDPEQGQRIPIKLDQVAPVMLAATIATEDASFFTNPGVNPRGLARAAWENLSPAVQRQAILEGSGGSSITQQLVKNLYIPPEERVERSLDRKVREAAYALELTQRYDKNQILEWYLNQINYGGPFNGIEAASEGYFSKPASELTLAEAALLAGIPQSPARYDPLNQPEAALTRRNEVLDLIAKSGSVQVGLDAFYTATPEDLEAAKAEPVVLNPRQYNIEAPHFVLNVVEPQLEAIVGKQAIAQGGLSVTTSLDMSLQRNTQAILERWINEFEAISNSHNGAVVVLDPTTGQILVYIGGRDYNRDDIAGNVDNLQALNSPGSTFKPFVYLASFIKLGWTPNTTIEDTPVTYREFDGSIFQPINPSKGYLGTIPIKTALGNSLNVPAFKTALRLGTGGIIEVAKKVGFTTLRGYYGPAIALGGVDLTALDLAYGYSVLANNGAMVGSEAVLPHAADERGLDPIAILKVVDRDGNVLYDAGEKQQRAQVIPAIQAYQVTSILTDSQNTCVTFGCGGVSVPGKTVGVKTGTSEPYDPKGPDAGKIGETWAFGYTPDYVVGVWAGNADNDAIINIFSTSISFRVMRDTMLAAYDGRPQTPFSKPAGYVEPKVVPSPTAVPNIILPPLP